MALRRLSSTLVPMASMSWLSLESSSMKCMRVCIVPPSSIFQPKRPEM